MKRGTEGREGSRAWWVENAPARGLQGSTGQSCPGGDGAAPGELAQRGFLCLPSIPSQGRAASDARIRNLCLPLSLHLYGQISSPSRSLSPSENYRNACQWAINTRG